MNPDEQLDLVRQALTCGLSNCVEWINDKAANRVRNDPANQGLQPHEIKALVIAHAVAGGQIGWFRENREDWADRRDYTFEAILAIAGFPHGLYVEMELAVPDAEFPEVSLLNAHPPSFRGVRRTP